MHLTLYYTDGCHLCDQVEEMLKNIHVTAAIDLTKIDIIECDKLIESYKETIPVLKRMDEKGHEMILQWPFSYVELFSFIKR